MSTDNIRFHDRIRKLPKTIPKYLFSRAIGIILWGLRKKKKKKKKKKKQRHPIKTDFESAMVNGPSLFELLKFLLYL